MKVNKLYIENLFKDIIEKNIFIKGSISNPVNKKENSSKINLKLIKIKNEVFIQLESFKDKKAFHENIYLFDFIERFSEIIDKFKQINKYLEFIDDTIKEMQNKKLIKNHIKIIDFGCGKSYLTFALQYYLNNIKEFTYEIIGLDLKKDVVEKCNKIVQELNCQNLEFLTGDIKDFNKLKDVDMVFSLHACNNATDYALLKGLELGAKAILAVPCCQHEFNEKMSKNKNSDFFSTELPLGKHGILFEKFTSLATDAFRAQALELCGFKTQVMEFIDMEHTPKNILIKAIKEKISKENLEKKYIEYRKFKSYLGIEPLLDELLSPYYLIKLN